MQDIGEKGGDIIMKKKINDPNMPIGKMIRIKNFLPPPEKLVFPSETVKVTIVLKRSSVNFFKQKAEKHHTKYQKMIRELLDRYAMQYSS